MISNQFLSKVQKGFKANTPGCLEHSFAMFEALLDAKRNQRQVVVAWLDLKNAYGSVRHNLIQFAISWFHVPRRIRQLIFDYYEKICAQIRVGNGRTRFFLFDIGLFQGCVLSCILFNCVFQLLLDLTAPLSIDHGYHFKDIPTVLHDQAFADDLSITSATPELNQLTIDVVMRFLKWYRLQANPKKCICMAMKRFDTHSESKYERHGDTVYCPFDPALTINGERLKFIVNVAAAPDSLQFDHFTEHNPAWAGLYRNSDLGCLFRRREHLGLQLTSLEQHYLHLQVVKCSLFKNSNDEAIREIYTARKARVAEFTRRWSGPNELEKLEPVADHNLRFSGQIGTAGLGMRKSEHYIAAPTTAERREKISATLTAQCEEHHVRHASCLVRQGVWTHWDDALPFDFSWENLIYGPGPRLLAFVLNSLINSVRTPDMFKLWGYSSSESCVLCGAEKCTFHHVLVNCKFALDQGRYTWRHDSVLLQNT